MKYNGIDCTQIFSVTKIEGLAPSLKTTMWSPTLGNGDRVSIARRPNKSIKVYGVIETDDAGDAIAKKEALYQIFRSSNEYVDIEFPERDELRYRGVAVSVQETAYWFTVFEFTVTLTCLPDRFGSVRSFSGENNVIQGNNPGTDTSVGQISFTISGDPDAVTVQLVGTSGCVQLVKPSDDTLAGNWMIDLEKRTIYRDQDLAMEYSNFNVTEFETFEVPSGDFEISFDTTVTDASYSFEERYL